MYEHLNRRLWSRLRSRRESLRMIPGGVMVVYLGLGLGLLRVWQCYHVSASGLCGHIT